MLRAILDDWRPVPRPRRLRSELEARLLPLLAARGLPFPLCNHKLRVGGRMMEVDCFWPDQRVVVELDGRQAHGHDVAYERDRNRDRDLTVAGYSALRITWAQLAREPDETLAAIAVLLRP
jgi:very-short-patch-repair endonuclease